MPPIERPWFRVYGSAVHNTKLQKLKPQLFKHWFNLMCLASTNNPRGILPPIADIAFQLRPVTEKQVSGILEELTALRLVDAVGDAFAMHDWSDWQKDRDVGPRKRGDNHANRDDNHANRDYQTEDGVIENHARSEEEKKREDQEEEPEPEREQSGAAQGVVPVYRAFERCFGRPLSPMEIENIKHLEDEHPRERIDYALREAAELNKRSVRYVQCICENQESNGDSHERPVTTTGARIGGRVGEPRELTGREYAELDRYGVFNKQPINLDI